MSTNEKKNYLAIDYGEKNVGIAYKTHDNPIVPSDSISYQTLPELIKRITNICNEKHIHQIIIGLPLNLKGEKAQQAKIVEEFSQALGQKIKLPIEFIDERFTSKMHQSYPNIDSYAAAEILSSYINRSKV
ncbi:Holliday junction resolvase RuvX [Patescibacteria group bacterium]|nr:Holliday junction resolvase RuvX [Patescibacteria group bacterium]